MTYVVELPEYENMLHNELRALKKDKCIKGTKVKSGYKFSFTKGLSVMLKEIAPNKALKFVPAASCLHRTRERAA